MREKRSIGVTVLGIVSIILGLLGLRMPVYYILHGFEYSLSNLLWISFPIVLAIALFVCGVAMFQLKHWAPKLFLSLMAVVLFYISYILAVVSLVHPLGPLLIASVVIWLLISLLPISLLFFYFTRPKVKEQFGIDPGTS